MLFIWSTYGIYPVQVYDAKAHLLLLQFIPSIYHLFLINGLFMSSSMISSSLIILLGLSFLPSFSFSTLIWFSSKIRTIYSVDPIYFASKPHKFPLYLLYFFQIIQDYELSHPSAFEQLFHNSNIFNSSNVRIFEIIFSFFMLLGVFHYTN